MSSSLSVQNGQFTEFTAYVTPHLINSVAATTAIIPVFYGFMVKSAQQMAKPIPKINAKVIFTGGIRAAVPLSIQMSVQKITEEMLMKTNKDADKSKFTSMLASSILVSILSTPALAIFNGQTMGYTALNSIKSLSAKQAMAIVSRETSFLFSLRVSDPVSDIMKESVGDNSIVKYSSAFATGAIGSTLGHPADTALTLWQKGMKIEKFSQLMRGAPIKAIAVGAFCTFYKMTQDVIDSLKILK